MAGRRTDEKSNESLWERRVQPEVNAAMEKLAAMARNQGIAAEALEQSEKCGEERAKAFSGELTDSFLLSSLD